MSSCNQRHCWSRAVALDPEGGDGPKISAKTVSRFHTKSGKFNQNFEKERSRKKPEKKRKIESNSKDE